MRLSFYITLLLVICCGFLFNGCYLLSQGTSLLRYTSSAKNTDSMIKDSSISEKTKTFISRVNEIRQFAQDSLGLNKNKNYTKYVKVNRSYLVDVVSAAEALSFKQYKWCFPIFGCFPNKGFFNRKDAEKEAARVATKGYDTIIDEVDAFSTLGILSDPLYSFMEDFNTYELASLIIHEQTHATIFIKNKLQFNEELATYVGNQGALAFIMRKNNPDTVFFKKIQNFLKDRDTYYQLLRNLYAELGTVYSSSLDSVTMRQKKYSTISDFKSMVSSKYDSLFLTKSFRVIDKLNINNAFLAIRMTYTLNLALMDSLKFSMGGDLKDVVNFAKTLKKSTDPEKEIQTEIERRKKL